MRGHPASGPRHRPYIAGCYGPTYIDELLVYDRNISVAADPNDADACLDAASERYFYHQDANFRVVALTDEAGAVAERYRYSAYGEPQIFAGGPAAESGNALLVSRVGNPFMHQGLHFDADTRTYHNRYRQYHPRLGRFMQRDPLGYVDGPNAYSYLGSNSIGWVDPLGLYYYRLKQAIAGVWAVGWEASDDAGRGETYQHAREYASGYADQGTAADKKGARNAARHTMWQARLTYKYGRDVAKKIGDIHEPDDSDDRDTQADLYNNEVGRDIGEQAKEEGKSIDEIDGMVDEAMEDGRVIRDRENDPRITPPAPKPPPRPPAGGRKPPPAIPPGGGNTDGRTCPGGPRQ